jgi:hypothetical protein
MTAAEATRLAQSDPVPNLTTQWVEAMTTARKSLSALTRALREVDGLSKTLAEHDVTVRVDLGPIGNAAAAARRDLEKNKDKTTFALPKLTTEEAAKLPPIR